MKLSRKAISLALAGVLTLSLAAPALAVEGELWYAQAQKYVTEQGLMTGTDKGFEPEGTVTRATVYQILFNMEGQPQADPSQLVDLDGEWFAPAAHWANGAQLVTGNTFHGERIITRQEVVALLYDYMNFRRADVSVGEDTNILSYLDVADVKEEAIPAFRWACGAQVVTGDEGGYLNPNGLLTRAELAALLMRLPSTQSVLTLEEYLAQGGEAWVLTGKNVYTVQGMMVSKPTSFHNDLEVTDYTAEDDGVSVVLKGTSGEQWISKLDKVIKTYTRADGKALTAADFAKKDTFIDLKTKAEPDTNFAMYIPLDVSVTVETAWGDVLHTNLDNAPHGQGDYLVCRVGEDKKPDLSDVWVVNGAVFPQTYDVSHIALEGQVTAVSKYGNITTDIPDTRMMAAGFVVGDILNISVGGTEALAAPYGTGYSNVDTGKIIALADSATGNVAVAINMGNFSATYFAVEGTPITISMGEKAGYLEEYEIRNIDTLRTNNRADYASDEVFANFRAVTLGDIPEGRLYRSSSPVNPELGRNTYADGLAEKAGIRTVLNLADSEEGMRAYEGFAQTYYAGQTVIPMDMGVDFAEEDFNIKLKAGLEKLADLEETGPILVHCNEGKDRAGFVTALLSALAGGSAEEIIADYMVSFENYYHVARDSARWEKIAQSNMVKSLCAIAGVETREEMEKVDLEQAVRTYLAETVGLSAQRVETLAGLLTAK